MNKNDRTHLQTSGPLGLSRRDFMAVGGLGVTGYALTKQFEPCEVLAQSSPPLLNTADAVIFVKLQGAISHMDTFGVKEGVWTPADWAITQRDDIILPNRIFPKLLALSEKIAIVNSIQSWVPVHQVGQYWLDTAHDFNASLAGERPHVGAVTAFEYQSRRRPQDVLPGFFTLAGNIQTGNGFLNGMSAPFPIDGAGGGQGRLVPLTGVPSLSHPPGRGPTGYEELTDMIGAIDSINRGGNPPWGKPISDYKDFYDGASSMISDPAVSEAFVYDDATRARYGNRVFGDACRVAFNLLKADKGVHFIQMALGSFDHHQQVYNNLRNLAPVLDNGLSALIEDLSLEPSSVAGQSLLDRTMIVVMGEFGRTPPSRYIAQGRANGLNANQGRDHYQNVQSTLFAGGGIRGGRMVGITNWDGSVIDDPQFAGGVGRPSAQGGPNPRMEDIGATIYSVLNIDWTRVIADTPSRRRYEYIPGGPSQHYKPIMELFNA